MVCFNKATLVSFRFQYQRGRINALTKSPADSQKGLCSPCKGRFSLYLFFKAPWFTSFKSSSRKCAWVGGQFSAKVSFPAFGRLGQDTELGKACVFRPPVRSCANTPYRVWCSLGAVESHRAFCVRQTW